MADVVFLERKLTARRGRTRTQLTLSVYKPVREERSVVCRTELRAGKRLLWPYRPELGGMAGVDDLQAFVLAMRMAACELLRFELDTGMRVDPWEWMDLIEFVGEAPISTHARDRVTEIKKSLRELLREYREHEQHGRKPRTARRKR